MIAIVVSLSMWGCGKGVDAQFNLWGKEVEEHPLEVMSEIESIEKSTLSEE